MRRLFQVVVCTVWMLCGLAAVAAGGIVQAVQVAQATEVIHSFDSAVVIQHNGTLRVTETITLTSAGEQIRQGIYRDFPLGYSGTGTHRGPVPFAVVAITRDGKSLSTSDVEYKGGNIRIFMREKGTPIAPGRHTFVLTYETGLQVRYFEQYDELNWNVTGAGWAFPIERASCAITVPGTVDQAAGWLGATGSKERNVTVERLEGQHTVRFTGQRGIARGEQMTVAVSFAKGVVAPEPAAPGTDAGANADASSTYGPLPWYMTLLYAVQQLCDAPWYQGLLVGLAVLYFFGFWWARGRDPRKGAIIPLFHPPCMPGSAEPLSPAALVYIRDHKRLSTAGFAGLLLLLAGRGFAKITENADKTFRVRLANGDTATLPPDAQSAFSTLRKEAGSQEEIDLNADPASRAAFAAVKNSLRTHYAGTWTSNTGILLLGWVVVVPLLLFAATMDMERFAESIIAPMGFMGGAALCYLFAGASLWNIWRSQRSQGGLWIIPALTALCGWLCIVAVLGGLVIACLYYMFVEDGNVAQSVIVLTAALFTPLMKAPTKEGRALMDKIEGFTLYMKTAEQARLAQLTKDSAPEDTPERFFSILPYAVALGQTANWCARYASQIAAGLIVSDTMAVHDWHSTDSVHDFTNSFTSASQPVTTSAFSSDGDSGGGGGGGSGGGSGGGGGGGC